MQGGSGQLNSSSFEADFFFHPRSPKTMPCRILGVKGMKNTIIMMIVMLMMTLSVGYTTWMQLISSLDIEAMRTFIKRGCVLSNSS